MANDLFRDVDSMADIIEEDSSDMYPKRKTLAERELEMELLKDSEEIEKEELAQNKAKKDLARDINLVACGQDHEMATVLRTHNKVNTKETREQVKELCKDFKTKEGLKPHNRENFYAYLKTNKEFKKIEDNQKGETMEPVKKKKYISSEKKVDEPVVVKKTEETSNKVQESSEKKKSKKEETPKIEIIEEDEKNNWALIAASALVIVAIIVALYFAFSAVKPTEESNTILALVNGEPIYNSMVDFREKTLQNMGVPFVDRTDLLNQIIDERILLQDADKKGIKVSTKEAEEQLDESLKSRGLALEDFKVNLEENAISYEETIKFYKESILINLYINDTILPKIDTMDDTLMNYYEDNKALFTIPKAVTVKHLLIMFSNQTENETFEEATLLHKEILKNPEIFCDLVKVNTDDIASKDTCGEYTFTEQDPLVPEFLEAGFRLKPGQSEIVKTQFGYHIILKVKDIPPKVQNFSEVKEQIKAVIQQQNLLSKYNERVEELKTDATIEIYSENTDEEIVQKPTINITEPVVELDNETEVTNSEKDAEVDYEISEGTEEEVKEPVEEVNKTPEVVEADSVQNPDSQTADNAETKQKEIVTCINEKADMYTVYWSPDNNKQLDVFGNYKDLIEVKECDKDKANYDSTCASKKLNIYPSWEIAGEIFGGVQSLTKLQLLTGC